MNQNRIYELAMVFVVCILFVFSIIGQGEATDLVLISLGAIFWVVRNLENSHQIDSTVQYAGFWRRLGSICVDAGVSGSFYLLGAFFFQNHFSFKTIQEFTFLIMCVVFIYMVKRWGQSPGKMVFGIKILKTDMSELGWPEVLLRDLHGVVHCLFYCVVFFLIFNGFLSQDRILIKPIAGIINSPDTFQIIEERVSRFFAVWFLSEPFVLLTNKKKRALHDYLAGTLVVVERSKEKISKQSWLIFSFSILIFMISFYFNYQIKFKDDLAKAQAGDVKAQDSVASSYYSGFLTVKDYSKALEWYEKAANTGDARAEEGLGIIYEKGKGVPVDKSEAIKWYSLSANSDNLKIRSYSERALKRLKDSNP